MSGSARLYANGVQLDQSPSAFGQLRGSNPRSADVGELRARMASDGYLLFRGFCDLERIASVRKAILDEVFQDRLRSEMARRRFKDVRDSGRLAEVRDFVQKGPLPDFFASFLGESALAFDYVWSRVVGPGECELPHCDSVYMNRGTDRLFTAWVPLVDVPRSHGAIMLLEGSHAASRLNPYRSLDVDVHRFRRGLVVKHGRIMRGIHYSWNPIEVQRELGGRWITADFRAGDVLVFCVQAMHCTLDNQSDGYRVTLDARYQSASEPVDDRYLGASPVGHARSRLAPLRGLIGLGRTGRA